MKTPYGKTVTMTFVSQQLKDRRMCWVAAVTFPPGAGADASLSVSVEDGTGVPVASGVFEFAGQSVAVRDGRGSLPYAAFVAGRHEKPVWLRRPGMESVPGSLTFA